MGISPPLGSVDKALRALQRLGEVGADGLPLTRFAGDLGLNKASLHRTLSALRRRGFVEQDADGNYRLGHAILTLADSYRHDGSLRQIFHEGLADLCARIGETCHLGVLIGEQIVYIDKVEPMRAVRIWSEIGWRNPAVSTALGRAILCQQYVDFESFSMRFSSPIAKRAPRTRTTLRSVWLELLEARRRGFAVDDEEHEPGISCVGVALLRGTEAIAAISITTPSDRMDPKRMPVVVQALRECIEPCLPPGLVLQRPMPGTLQRARSTALAAKPRAEAHA